MCKKSETAAQQHDFLGMSSQNDILIKYNRHKDAAWFKDGGNLGLFLHYGLSSVNSCVDLSWGMIANKPYENRIGCEYRISPRNYFAMAKDFNPCNFEIDRLIKNAKAAGFTYAVLTARHHEGFALWPSRFGDFNIGKYLEGRDLIEEYIKACRKYDMKIGLYYSPPDWYYNKEYMSFNYHRHKHLLLDMDHNPVKEIPQSSEVFEVKFRQYLKGQLHELLTNYGKIDVLWFDGTVNKPYEVITPEEIRALQPGIIFNDRLHGAGDFTTAECGRPDIIPKGCWEYCDIWAEGHWWAFMHQSKGYKSSQWLKENYRFCKNNHGNFLVNVGLKADGSAPEIVYKLLDDRLID